MQGEIRVDGRVAKIKLRVSVQGLPEDTSVSVSDLMLQPGGSSSGWMPHVTELPWSAGVTATSEGSQ
mgnify:CR=1 FL=1